MTFINDWESKLNDSYAEFAEFAVQAQDVDFVYGLLATAVLWPIRQAVRQYNLEAIQALQQIVGTDRGGPVLSVVQRWPDDRLAAARSLAEEAQSNALLRAALAGLEDYFKASPAFMSHLARVVGGSAPAGNITLSEISNAELTVGSIISGIVGGDVISGDQVAGDKIAVAGDNITYVTHFHQGLASQPKAEVPPLDYEPETLPVTAGPFLMGSDTNEAHERPLHEVQLAAYRLGKYPVTNRQYAEFIKRERRQEPPAKPRWFLREPPVDRLDHPVTGVSWHDAKAYCDWLSEQTGRSRIYRLPTEAEWEKGARGTDGRLYPWGNDWIDGHCNANSNDSTAVIVRDGQLQTIPRYPDGVSPYGCYDMLGNVQEWTSTLWGSDLTEDAFPYPYRAGDGREDLEADRHLHRVYRVHRGSAFRDHQAKLRCSARGASSADSTIRWRGFRVVLEL